MKFNHEKWERIQCQRQAGFEQCRLISEEWRDAKDQAAKTETMFVNDFGLSNGAMQTIRGDSRLSAADLSKRLAVIADGSLSLEQEFGIRVDGARPRLIRVYSLHLEAKKLDERREAQSELNQAFGASFARLQEFAQRHVKVNAESHYA